MRSVARYFLVAVVSGLLGATLAPAVAAGFDATNADKVDGLHATKFNNTASKRRNKLVATNRGGVLPNNIIKLAPNAAKLQGKTLAQVVDLATDEYTAGAGLGLTDNAFSVLASFRLPQGCADGEVPASAAGAWQCLDLPEEASPYLAGTGLTLTDNTFSVDSALVQSRVSGTCSVGSYIRAIAADGQVTCSTDANTTYSAGQGLGLSGTAFSVIFAGTGVSSSAARADHNHNAAYLGIGAKAADSERLDGLDSLQLISDSCPAGWTSDGLLCWRNTSDDGAGLSLPQAVDFCRTRGGRLPLLSEFIAMKQSGINIGGISGDWTGSSAGDDNSIYINNGTDANNMDGVRANSTTTNAWARCVRPLVNDLGSS